MEMKMKQCSVISQEIEVVSGDNDQAEGLDGEH